ncbi:unnamed protein product [Adineta ricciae]|uniref:Berberine/berberine-like domain-containing protein n=1 Tax=Adineta ricciae TaxID=249248 RepID=A0A813MKG4_ADIRI|nr:unnamed protein product [Adineta ricciae]CAF1249734.1 unnamed protein product [Adineta ricciae]
MIYSQSLNDNASQEDQDKLATVVADKIALLKTIFGDSQSTAYMIKADSNEVNWQQKFFGTTELYRQLKTIKDKIDPNDLLSCKKCVGSDD